MLRVAKRGLVDELDISGAPKIIAEKSLVVLSKLNADRPPKSCSERWGGLDPIALGAFLLKVVKESKWVQSQDIALTFFARLVLSQKQIPIRSAPPLEPSLHTSHSAYLSRLSLFLQLLGSSRGVGCQ